MRIVVDTNIIIAALIKDSITRKIIVESGWEFYYPEISIHEIREHKNLILEKSGLSENEYLELLKKLLSYINIVPQEMFFSEMTQAENLIGAYDPDDVVFLATALAMHNSIIWSNDPVFSKQGAIKALETKHILIIFQNL